jgi:hypothetical protein
MARRIGAFLLGLAFVLLIADVVLGVLEFMIEGPQGAWFEWARGHSLEGPFQASCVATATFAIVGAGLLQLHARRRGVSGTAYWLAGLAVCLAALHISFFTYILLD